jgi:hypothetical protein
MKEKTRKMIEKIILIKVNLLFMIIFSGAMLYAAEMLGEAIRIREILFWASMLLMIMFQAITPMRKALDMVEELVANKRDANVGNSESEDLK